MENFKIRLSLKYKLLFLLTVLPLVSLGLYLGMATSLFQQDKVAYVFDSSATVSRSLATQMRIEMAGTYTVVRTLAEHFVPAQKSFSPEGTDLFNKDPRIQAIMLYRPTATGQYTELGELVKPNAPAETFAKDMSAISILQNEAAKGAAYLMEYPQATQAIAVSYRLGGENDPKRVLIVALYNAEDLLDAFSQSGLYNSFVVTRDSRVAIGGANVAGDNLSFLPKILKSSIGEGTAEASIAPGQKSLISYSSVGMGNLVVISTVNKSKALKAVSVLIAKSLLFFVALIASTLLISVFASSRLTATLRDLFDATRKIAQGDFNVRVQANARDEVGGLAQSFNWMAAEVSRLMRETAEKARMQGELATVKTVQETLFPPAESQFGPLKIRGHFEPASECGGDWWNYSRLGNRIFIWIGDATGHGAPAALITSAARSAAAVIESLPDMGPGKALSILNRAIHQTSKGQIMMTFFLGCIDLDKGTLTYASASHDPPYLLRMREDQEKLSRRDLVPLNDVNGPRLGDRKDFEYEDITVDFAPGDQLFFYTDGILDVQDPSGKKWGERTFLKTLIESANLPTDASHKIENIRQHIDQFRSGSDLIDDVTMVLCEYEKKSAA